MVTGIPCCLILGSAQILIDAEKLLKNKIRWHGDFIIAAIPGHRSKCYVCDMQILGEDLYDNRWSPREDHSEEVRRRHSENRDDSGMPTILKILTRHDRRGRTHFFEPN